MTKIAILGDTHFGMRSDSLIFHEYYEKFYTEVFFPYLKDNNITLVYQLGDLFDRRKYINFNSLYLSRKYFFDKLKENNIQLVTLLGNHDVSYKNTLEVNSSELLLRDYDNIEVIRNFTTKNIDGINVDVIPWICEENETEILDQVKKTQSHICFGHFEIDGFAMDRGNIHQGGLDRKQLMNYDIVLSGHFHHKSDDGHIYYVGTPGEMTWIDYNDPRGFHVLEMQSREIEFIQNPHKIFHKIYYNDEQQDFEFWKKFNYDAYQKTYVKLVVVTKQNPFMFDNVVDGFLRVGVADISIVEDFTDSAIENDDELIDQAEDTFSILSKYIDNLTLDVDSKQLKLIMKEIYVEALSTEKAE